MPINMVLRGCTIAITLLFCAFVDKFIAMRRRTSPIHSNIPIGWNYNPEDCSDDPEDYSNDPENSSGDTSPVHVSKKRDIYSVDNEDKGRKDIHVNFELLAEIADDCCKKEKSFQYIALETLTCCKVQYSERGAFHWRMARALWNCSFSEKVASGTIQQDKFLRDAFHHAQTASHIDENNPLTQRWVSLIFSEMYCHHTVDIHNLKVAKCLLEQALGNNPNDLYISRELFFVLCKINDYEGNGRSDEIKLDGIDMDWTKKLKSKRSCLYLSRYLLDSDNSFLDSLIILQEGFSMKSVTPEDIVMHGEIIVLARDNNITLSSENE